MPGQYERPQDQASVNKLVTSLSAKAAELEAILADARAATAELQAVSREATAARQSQAREMSAARPAGRAPAAAPAEATAAIRQQAVAEGELNAQTVRQIELQAQAAAAARRTATAMREGTLGAAQRVQAIAQGSTPEAQAIATQAAAVQQARVAPVPTSPAAAREIATRQVLAEASGVGAGAAPAAARTGAASADAGEQVTKLSVKQQQLAASAATAADREAGFARSVEYSARQMSLGTNVYQKHGALTTEFIRAAAAGQVTVRDLGNEMLLTLGKFAGWTTAAAATYGAVRALGQMKEGALEAASGVQQLTRFLPDLNRDRAFEQIAKQASAVNVPIANVTEASGAFARIFKNQGDVMTATHVALLATKLDNIDLADSYRYLTALTQEYGLSANQLPGVFDQISAAQRELGARVSETFPALARSAAAVKNAGGDLNQLLAELSLTIVRTGQTGASVGTAFYRGASNPQAFFKPANQDFMRTLGIDPKAGFTQALGQAIGMENLSGAEKRRLAQSFFGTQFGGRFASIIGAGPATLERFTSGTSPAASKGSAQQELNKVLDSANEKLKALGVQAQVFGAELARSGALTPLGALVGALTEALKLVNDLTRAVGDLPGGLGHVLVPMAEIVGLLKLAQRFNLASALPGYKTGTGIGGFLGQPGRLAPTVEKQTQIDVQKGLSEQETHYRQMEAQTTAANARLQDTIRAQNRFVTALGAQGADQEVILAEEKRLQTLLTESQRLAYQEAEARVGLNMTQAQKVAYDANIARGMSAQASAQAIGVNYRPGSIARGVGPIGEPVVLANAEGAAATTAAARAKLDATRGTVAEVAARDELAAATLAEARVVGASTVSEARLRAASDVSAASLTGASLEMEVTRSRLSRITGAITGNLIPGLILLSFVYDGIKNALADQDQAQKQMYTSVDAVVKSNSIANAYANADAMAKAAADLHEKTALGPFSSARGIPLIGPAANALALAGQNAFKGINDQNANAQAVAAQIIKELTKPITTSTLPVLSYPQTFDPAEHRDLFHDTPKPTPVMGADGNPLTYTVKQGGIWPTLLEQAKNDAKDVKNTVESRKQWKANIAAITKVARDSMTQWETGQPADVKAIVNQAFNAWEQDIWNVNWTLQQRLQQLPRDAATSFKVLMQTDPKQVAGDLGTQADRVKAYGAEPGAIRDMAARLNNLNYQFAGSHNSAELQLLAKAQSDLDSAVKQSMQDLLDQAQAATDPAERQSLTSQAVAKGQEAVAALRAAEAATRGNTADKKAAYDQAVKALADAEGIVASISDPVARALAQLVLNASGITDAVAAAYKAWQDALRHGKTAVRADKKAESAAQLQLRQAKDGTTDPNELASLRAQIAQAQATGDPEKQAQIAIRLAQHDKQMATNTKERLAAELQLVQGENQLAQARLDLIQSQTALAEAQAAGDPSAIAAAAMRGAQQLLAASKGPADRIKAQTAIVDAQNQAWQASQDRAQTLSQIAQAQAEGNPVAQASLAEQLAGHEIASARGEGDRLKGQLDLVQAENMMNKAIQDRIDAQFEYRKSLTQDPVKQAVIDVQQAQADLAHALAHGGPGTADSLRAQAKLNDARNKQRDTQVTAREDTIQFNLDMNRISTETAISQYQALLRIHGITTQVRRQILEKIKQLRDSGSSDFAALNLGSIRLPTPYEIRRAVLAAQAGINVTQHYATTIQVTDERSASAVGVQMDRYHSGTYKAIQRATGSR